MIQKCRYVLLIVLFYLGGPPAYAQNYEVDTTGIRTVVAQWNEAHNEINEDAFNELYAPKVLFYTNDLVKRACIEIKLSLLSKSPFSQRIASDLHLAFYEEGIVYCGFTKEVETGKSKKSYPSYLLLKRYGDRYLITGESDLITDRNQKFRLSLGPQIHISELSSASASKGSKFKSVYAIVVLFLLLSVAGVAIYFFRRPVRKANTAKVKLTVAQEEPSKIELEKGHAFEQFVVNRFRQKGDVFKWMDATSDKGTAGYFPASNQNPDLQYEYRFGGKSYPFSVECKFRSVTSGEIMITKDGQLERYKKFEIEKGMSVFVVLGLGGTPKNPEALFVIPLAEVKQVMDRKTLQAYKALPTFYYNIEERRLY